MSINFQDRVSTYPNRYKLKKSDGTSELVTLERADEPTTVGTPLNADTFNAMQKGVTPRNLLDNSDFTNPVNQRGLTSYSTQNGYSIDRWITASANFALNLTEQGLTVSFSDTTKTCYFQQRFHKGMISPTKTYTIAAYYAGEGARTTVVKSGENVELQARHPEFFIGDTVDGVQIALRADETLVWAALYEGEYTAETLPEYQPKGYSAELAECQRYYFELSGSTDAVRGVGVVDSSKVIVLTFYLPTIMRTTPTVEGVELTKVKSNGSTANISAPHTDSVDGFVNNQVSVRIAFDTTPLASMVGRVAMGYANKLVLNADL